MTSPRPRRAGGAASAQILTFPITPDYVANWTIPKAICEAVSNAFDENAHIRFEWKDGWLEIEDDGPGMPRKGLLLGYSTKRDKDDAIGQFGEGTALLLLTLARTHTPMSIETVGFRVEPKISHSANLDAKVLQLHFSECARKQGTLIRIKVAEKIANEVRGRFLRFEPGYTLPQEPGRLIRGISRKIFVGGVLVKERSNHFFSYDLALGSMKKGLNRDRTFLDEQSAGVAIREIVASIKDPEVLVELVTAAMNDKGSSKELGFDTSEPLVRKALAKAREILFGDELVAVASTGTHEAATAEYQGYRILGNRGKHQFYLKQIFLAMGIPSIASVAKETLPPEEVARHRRVRRIEWIADNKLSVREVANLDWAKNLCVRIYGTSAVGEVKVLGKTTFEASCKSRWCNGIYSANTRGGVIGIHQEILHDKEALLHTMIHEMGHRRAHNNGATRNDYADLSAGFERSLVALATSAVLQLENVPLQVVQKSPTERALEVVRSRMIAQNLSKAGLARAAFATKGAVERVVGGQLSIKANNVLAIAEVLGLDGNLLGVVLLADSIRSLRRNKRGMVYNSAMAKSSKILLENLAKNEAYAKYAKDIHSHLSRSVDSLSDQTLYEPYQALATLLEKAA